MDDHGGDAAGNNGGIKEYLEETRQAFKNFRGSHGHEAHPDGHGNDDGFTSVHFMLQQDCLLYTSLLMRTPRRIYLAGDYLGSWYTETAIQTGLLAGEDINSKLYTDTLLPSNGFSY